MDAAALHRISALREFWPTIVATLIILSSARPGAGFLLPLWLPILLVWSPTDLGSGLAFCLPGWGQVLPFAHALTPKTRTDAR